MYFWHPTLRINKSLSGTHLNQKLPVTSPLPPHPLYHPKESQSQWVPSLQQNMGIGILTSAAAAERLKPEPPSAQSPASPPDWAHWPSATPGTSLRRTERWQQPSSCLVQQFRTWPVPFHGSSVAVVADLMALEGEWVVSPEGDASLGGWTGTTPSKQRCNMPYHKVIVCLREQLLVRLTK